VPGVDVAQANKFVTVVSVPEEMFLSIDKPKTEFVSGSQDKINVVVVPEEIFVSVEVPQVHVVTVSEEKSVVAVGAVGPPGPPSAGAVMPVRKNIPAGHTLEIEAISAALFRSAKWLLTVTDQTNNQYKVGEVLAFHNDVDARCVHYAIMGDPVSYSVDTVLQAGSLSLQVQNLSSVELVIDAVRIGTIPVIF
jgi:hypothetical protein